MIVNFFLYAGTSNPYLKLLSNGGDGTPDSSYALSESEDTFFSSSDVTGLEGEFVAIVFNQDNNPIYSGFVNFSDRMSDWAYDQSGTSEFRFPLSLTVLPATVRQSELHRDDRLRSFVKQRSPIFASVYDSANEPVNLTGRELEFTIDLADKSHFLTIPGDQITITGTDNNTFYFDPPDELVSKSRLLSWSLRDADGVITSGELEILYAP